MIWSIMLYILGLLAVYFVYTRAIRMFMKKRYYEQQGAVFLKGVTPVLGNLLRFKKIMENSTTNEHPWVISIREDFGTGK